MLVVDAALDHGREADAKQIVEVAPRQGRQAMQQEAGLWVGPQHGAVAVERQEPGTQRAQVLAPVVEGDHEVGAVVLPEQAGLDLGRGHPDQRLGVLLPGAAMRGGVQYASQLAVGTEDRRRRAGERVMADEEMLAAMDRHRLPGLRHGAQRVGAASPLRPHRSWADVGGPRRGAEARVGDGVQQHAIGVGEGDQEVGAGDLAI